MSNIKYTAVGGFIGKDTIPFSQADELINQANKALEEAGSPLRFTTYDATTDKQAVKQQAAAETMLLDWITDAEIGESLFNALFHLDNGMAAINEIVGSDALVSGKGARAWGQLTEARRMWAAHLRWLDEIGTRRGRAPLAEYDRELIAE